MSSTAEDGRRYASFGISGRRINVYQLGDGAKTALAMALEVARRKPAMGMVRVWSIIEMLIVHGSDWDFIDEGFVSGKITMDEMMNFLGEIGSYEWDDDADDAVESAA